MGNRVNIHRMAQRRCRLPHIDESAAGGRRRVQRVWQLTAKCICHRQLEETRHDAHRGGDRRLIRKSLHRSVGGAGRPGHRPGRRQTMQARSADDRPRRGTAPCARDGAGCRAWIWPAPVSRGLDRRVRPLADTALLVRRRWQLAWGGASPNLLARAWWLAQYGAATASDAPPYWGMRCSLQPTKTDRKRLSTAARSAPLTQDACGGGKPPGSMSAGTAVSNADSPGANPLPVRPRENTSKPTAVANHKKLAQHRPSSIHHWLSQPG
jgi:hypothetical protein